jgi:UDP-2,3-diacylglucosamine hydrolase
MSSHDRAAGADAAHDGPLAIICGSGNFPQAVADAVAKGGRRVVLFGLKGFADPAVLARYPHHWARLGEFGRFRRLARAEGCRDVVFIGALVRPSLAQLRPDWTTLRLLPRIAALFRGGDDHLLTGVARIFEEHGFRLVGAHEVAPEILVPPGTLGRHQPTARDLRDIERGLALLAAIGPFDVGQAVVVADGRILAIEAAEGTDGMLAHTAEMRRRGRISFSERVGVLVKATKADQDRRLDLPSVGTDTVAAAAAAGLAGIAVEAAGTITDDLARLIRAADGAGLFVVGIRAASPLLPLAPSAPPSPPAASQSAPGAPP